MNLPVVTQLKMYVQNLQMKYIGFILCVCFREDKAACEFWLEWETRAACAVKQVEVEMVNGTIKVHDTGATFSLGALYYRCVSVSLI